jgi:hypothetical protein
MRSTLLPALALVLAAACNDGSRPAPARVDEAPTLAVEEPAAAVVVPNGAVVRIAFRDDDPDSVATTSVLVDLDDGNPATRLYTEVASGLAESDGALREVLWDTTGMAAGVYHVVIVTVDGSNVTEAVAPGTVEVLAPAPAGEPMELRSLGKVAVPVADAVHEIHVHSYPDGSYVLTGLFQGAITFGAGQANETTLQSPGQTPLFVARFAADHGLVYARQFDDGLLPIRAAALAGGTTLVVYAANLPGDVATRILRIDALGNEVFRRTEDGALFPAQLAHATGDDSFVVVAEGSGAVRLDPGGPDELVIDAGADRNEVFVRYDASARPLWAKVAQGDADDRRVAGRPDGSFAYFAGSASDGMTLDVGEATQVSVPPGEGVLALISRDGSLEWTRPVPTASNLEDLHMERAVNGGIVLGGTFEDRFVLSEGRPDEVELLPVDPSDPQDTFFLAMYAGDGSLAWAKRDGGADDHRCLGLAHYEDGTTVVLVEYETGTDQPSVFGAGGPAELTTTADDAEEGLVYARYRLDGSLEHARRDADDFEPGSAGIAGLPDGSFLVAAVITGPAFFGQGDPNLTSVTDSALVGGALVAHYSR